MDVHIDPSWKAVLQAEFDKPYFADIVSTIKAEIAAGQVIYPPGKLMFNAFDKTPFEQVKVVILGQDPYHGVGQAQGLCFSVPKGVRIPPSLTNIYKELLADVGATPPNHGCLEEWAAQGVFMPNAILTVRANQAASHSKIGWQIFTDAVIRALSEHKEGLVFMLWGGFARAKKALIDTHRHYVLEAAHPSPLAQGAFFGCKHFSQANTLLLQQGKSPINWQLSNI